jgi:ABC-type histidine transport system ATPase subunit
MVSARPDPGVSGCSLGSWPVDRIAIIGCGGSGKSHLSRSLGILLGITPVHLDGQMAPRVRGLIADHAGNAQVIVLRCRRAARDYLAVVSLLASLSAGVVAASEERG